MDYAIAADQAGAQILKQFDSEHCEIGAHLHPWANPPFFDETSEFSSHVINLPTQHVEAKLDALVNIIKQNIGVEPKSFRTGRWGINGDVLKMLISRGFEVDSSIYPLYKNEYFSCVKAPRKSYFPDFADTNLEGQQRDIVEIPVTCGFNRSNTKLAQSLHKLMETPPFTWLHINGLLWHSLLLRKLYLSPELCSAKDMIRLVKARLKKGDKLFHMYLHSSSLVEQVTGLNNELDAREKICKRIAEVVKYIQQHADVEFVTLTQAQSDAFKNEGKG